MGDERDLIGQGLSVVAAALALILALAVLMGAAGSARAAYPGANGVIVLETFSSSFGPPPYDDSLAYGPRPITACQSDSSTPSCDFGTPSYSPDGRTIVVSRLVPVPDADGYFSGSGNQGALELVQADGTGQRLLSRQTADDEHPSFLPSGRGIVFDGRASPGAPVNLFTVNADGTGLSQLTQDGGSHPAPCANGTIAFVKHGDIYLLARDRRTQRRLTFLGGVGLDCSPDSRAIAFLRRNSVYTIAANGQHLRRVASAQPPPPYDSGASVYAPVFSPDGHEIAFLADYRAPRGDDVYLEFAREGRRAAPAQYVGGSGFGPGGDGGYSHLVGGIGWQPVLASECSVPDLVGKSLAVAKKLLNGAHCGLGKVTPPQKPGRRLVRGRKRIVVIGSQSPRAGSLELGHPPVALALVYKTVKTRRR